MIVLSNVSLTDRACAIRWVGALQSLAASDFFLCLEEDAVAHAKTPRELVKWALFEKGALRVRHEYDLAKAEAWLTACKKA
jgi:hypothetical protein